MTSLKKWVLGAFAFVALSLGLAAPAQAYDGYRGGLSITFGDPYSGPQFFVPIGHHRYHHRRYYGYYSQYHPQYYGGYGYYQPRPYYGYNWRYRPYYYRNDYGWRHPGWRHNYYWRHHRWH